MIDYVDEFIIYDDMQFTKRDWRNRNIIKTPQNNLWLTIPVEVKGKFLQKIRDTRLVDSFWAADHWTKIVSNYKKAPYFLEIQSLLEPLYKNNQCKYLSEVNEMFLVEICKYLDIKIVLSKSWDYELIEGKTERLLHLCEQAGATEYISGPAARKYLDLSLFKKSNIKVTFFDFFEYKKYDQLWGDFDHNVSIVDLMFNSGQRAQELFRANKNLNVR